MRATRSAAAHSLSRVSEGASAVEEPEGSSDEDAPPPPEEPFVEDEEPGEIEPLTPENIERMLHERAPFFQDPDEPTTEAELEAVEGDDTLPPPPAPPVGSVPPTRALDPRVRRAQERARRRREGQRRLLMLIAAVAVLIVVIVVATGGSELATDALHGRRLKAAHQGRAPPTSRSRIPPRCRRTS